MDGRRNIGVKKGSGPPGRTREFLNRGKLMELSFPDRWEGAKEKVPALTGGKGREREAHHTSTGAQRAGEAT